jgi:hypothetical protein
MPENVVGVGEQSPGVHHGRGRNRHRTHLKR